MANESTYMLFCPPMPPLRLTGEAVGIGRHPDCRLNISMDDVSRHHAEVRLEGGLYVVQDLGSTNGTFVNGASADSPLRLSPGDRIDVGETGITFCEVDPGTALAAADAGARTVIFDRDSPMGGEAEFRGDLREMPCPAIFQLMEMNRNTGRLDVQSTDGPATVWFENGQPVHGLSEKNAGFEAAMTMVGMRAGRFCFTAGEVAPEKTIQASVTEVLMEACRLEDEASRSA